MKSIQSFSLTVLATCALLLGACATEESAQTGPSGSGRSGITSPEAANVKSGGRPAPGADEDSLEACMGRIPKNATSGQRMLAEGSCKRDDATRK